MRDGRYGTNLVVRGTSDERIAAALAAVVREITAAGGSAEETVDA